MLAWPKNRCRRFHPEAGGQLVSSIGVTHAMDTAVLGHACAVLRLGEGPL